MANYIKLCFYAVEWHQYSQRYALIPFWSVQQALRVTPLHSQEKKKLIWICPYIVRTFSSRTVTRIEKKSARDITLSHKDYRQARYGKQFGELVYTSWEWKGWILCSVLHEKYKDSCHIIYSTYNSMLTPEVWANKNWVIISIN